MTRFGSISQFTAGLVLIGALALGTASVALSEEEEPTPDVSHPSHIHVGDCPNLDPNPAAPLNNIEPRLDEGDEDDANQPEGVLTAARVLYAQSEDVEYSWDDMLATSHAINVHMSDEDIESYIACGDIGGVVVDDTLVIALQPQNDSGYHGIAILTKDEDDNVDVEVYLAEPATTEPEATPVN
jgi:hypothetical protein